MGTRSAASLEAARIRADEDAAAAAAARTKMEEEKRIVAAAETTSILAREERKLPFDGTWVSQADSSEVIVSGESVTSRGMPMGTLSITSSSTCELTSFG